MDTDQGEELPIYSHIEKDRNIFHHLGSNVIDFIQTLVIFGAIFSVIYLFVAQPHKVSGLSMFPTFHDGDYILTDKFTYRFHDPQHSDVIVLKNPHNEEQDFIKRIIGLPSNRVEVKSGHVFLNGKQLNEDYLPNGTYTNASFFLKEGQSYTVKDGEYIVMGDNRPHSSDSREWGIVKTNEIIGRVFFRYWPPQSFGLFKGK